MRKEYDFSQAQKNPYVRRLKQQITIRLDEHVISYFKNLSDEIGMPYQNLINLFLRDCVGSAKKPKFSWEMAPKKKAARRA